MGRISTVTVSGELAEFLEGKVTTGDYASEADVVAAALTLLREYDEGLAAIRAAIEEGEASGEPQPFDPEQFLREMHQKHGV